MAWYGSIAVCRLGRVCIDDGHSAGLLLGIPAFFKSDALHVWVPFCCCGLDSCSGADFRFSPDTCPAAEWPAGFICWYSAIPSGPVRPCRGCRGTGFMFEPRFRFWVRSMPCCGMTDGLPLLVFRRFPMSGILAHTGLCPVLRTGSMFGCRFQIQS